MQKKHETRQINCTLCPNIQEKLENQKISEITGVISLNDYSPLYFKDQKENDKWTECFNPAFAGVSNPENFELDDFQDEDLSLIETFGGNFMEIVIGGAPLNHEVETFFRKIKFPFTIGYGMTECGPLISYEP